MPSLLHCICALSPPCWAPGTCRCDVFTSGGPLGGQLEKSKSRSTESSGRGMLRSRKGEMGYKDSSHTHFSTPGAAKPFTLIEVSLGKRRLRKAKSLAHIHAASRGQRWNSGLSGNCGVIAWEDGGVQEWCWEGSLNPIIHQQPQDAHGSLRHTHALRAFQSSNLIMPCPSPP